MAELAARNVTRVTLELGGKSANVLLEDADLSTAVKVGGQRLPQRWSDLYGLDAHAGPHQPVRLGRRAGCAAGGDLRPGRPDGTGTKLGPMVSAAQRDRVRGLIETAVREGARVVTGGVEPPEGCERGYFVRPTVLADVDPDSTVAQEVVFGPVLSVLRYDDEAEALAIANNSVYGLAGAVWSADADRALAFARKVRTGAVDVNGGRYNPMAPFGGYKRSGIGRELGSAGLEEFLELQSIQL